MSIFLYETSTERLRERIESLIYSLKTHSKYCHLHKLIGGCKRCIGRTSFKNSCKKYTLKLYIKELLSRGIE